MSDERDSSDGTSNARLRVLGQTAIRDMQELGQYLLDEWPEVVDGAQSSQGRVNIVETVIVLLNAYQRRIIEDAAPAMRAPPSKANGH